MDQVESFALRRLETRMGTGPYAASINEASEIDLDVGAIINDDMPIPNTATDLNDDELINDEAWMRASQTLYEHIEADRKPEMVAGTRMAQPRDNNAEPMTASQGGGYMRGRAPMAHRAPTTPQEYGAWGLEFVGQLNHNITHFGFNSMKMRDADANAKFALYHLVKDYERLPDFSWSGTKRFFKGVTSDPTTYVGLGTLGIGAVGRAGFAQSMKSSAMQMIKKGLNPKALAIYEGAGYMAADDAMRQNVDMQAGVQGEFDLVQNIGQAALGATAVGGLVGAGELAKVVGPEIAAGARNVIDSLGQAADARIADRAADTSVTLNAGVDPTPAIDAALSAAGSTVRKVKLSKAEKEIFARDAKDKNSLRIAVSEAERIKNEYPTEQGWLPINVQTNTDKPTFKIKKNGSVEVRWQLPAYAFHLPPGEKLKGPKRKAQIAEHKQNLVDTTVSDVSEIVDRARQGDSAAIEIINQANWYRSMRTRLRKEFGGLADVFADVIGATSAQTNVQQNYENALTVLRRFTRGEFDEEIALYQARIDAGKPMGNDELTRLHKDKNNPFKLITPIAHLQQGLF